MFLPVGVFNINSADRVLVDYLSKKSFIPEQASELFSNQTELNKVCVGYP